jgi:hypothetical protein
VEWNRGFGTGERGREEERKRIFTAKSKKISRRGAEDAEEEEEKRNREGKVSGL